MTLDWTHIDKTLCTEETIVKLLSLTTPEDTEALRSRADHLTQQLVGNVVYYRGLVEFSNVCALNCLYCGIRRDNSSVTRYTLSQSEILDAARWCTNEGYGSLVLQSGEVSNPSTVDFICDTVRQIKKLSISETLPQGLGITLSVGVHGEAIYRRFREAGAHRYLLRIETTDNDLFARIHPDDQTLDERIQALHDLRSAGFQVGTGVMIGLPGQTLEMLARDVLFFKSFDVDMVGMGPYQPHKESPMADWPVLPVAARMQLALNMIAVTRLVLRNANIVSTTALQALTLNGREMGLSYGANITMPNLTPQEARSNYQLYDGKPCLDENRQECSECLRNRIHSVGKEVGFNEWGDSKRFEEARGKSK